MRVLLLLVHGLSAVLLLGALTHQAIALWWPAPRGSAAFARALRAVHPERYAKAVVVLFVITAFLGGCLYPPFRVLVRAHYLDAHAPWATWLFEMKEHAAAVGLAVLPSYWIAWRGPGPPASQRSLTTFLTVIAWWNFVVGHLVNNARGL